MSEPAQLALSDLVEATGVPASTVHHWMRCELLPPPLREANRYSYDQRHLRAITVIKLLRDRKGLSLEEIAGCLQQVMSDPEEIERLQACASGDSRDRIVQAAIDRFQTQSLNEVTMADIADTAGVAKGSIYRYFPSKEELFSVAVETELRRAAGEFAQTVENLGGPEGLKATPDKTAEAFATVIAKAMPLLLETGTRAAKGHQRSEEQARHALRILAHATGGSLVGPESPEDLDQASVRAGLEVIQTAFSVMLSWAVGTDWPPDQEIT